MDISVVICTYNRCDSLRKLLVDLKSLRQPEQVSYEILIVDNNSKDDTRTVVDMAIQESPGVLKYIFESRQGKSYALNTGVKSAKGEIIAFSDDDVQIDGNWLIEIKRAFDCHDCIGIGGRILPVWLSDMPWWYEEHGPYRLMVAIVKMDLGETPCELRTPAWGANMAFRRSAFEKYGYFRTDLGPTADSLIRGEDSEFSWRLMRGGETLTYVPRMLVYHPVEEKRTRQEYFLKWYFDYGRATVRIEGVPEGAVCYFGVPRYLFRQFLVRSVKWIFCINRKRRFYYKLQTYLSVGTIVESRARSSTASH